jgi:hypothetical protein
MRSGLLPPFEYRWLDLPSSSVPELWTSEFWNKNEAGVVSVLSVIGHHQETEKKKTRQTQQLQNL